MGRNARILQFDISNRQERNEVLSSDIEKNGKYYGIVLNAGIAKDNVFMAMENEEWYRGLNIKFGGI